MLQDWIGKEKDDGVLLPFTHATSWRNFEKVINQKKIINNSEFPPSELDGGGEKVIYLFYGLPYYAVEIENHVESSFVKRPSKFKGTISSNLTFDLPVVFLFKSEVIVEVVERFYPFDTGAFFSGRLTKDFNEPPSDLVFYEVRVTDGCEIKKYISRYFSCNENYCYGQINFNNTDRKEPREENLLNLLNNSGYQANDSRINGIEAHILQELIIRSNVLDKLIVPFGRLKIYNEYPEKISKAFGIDVSDILTYIENKRFNPIELRGVIIEQVGRMYNDEEDYDFCWDNLKV